MSRLVVALLLLCVAGFAAGQNCGSATGSPILSLPQGARSIDQIEIVVGVAGLVPRSYFNEVVGSTINITVYGTFDAAAIEPVRCSRIYFSPLAGGTYTVNFFQSIGPVGGPVETSLVTTRTLVITDSGIPPYANVLPKYPVPQQPLSIRVRMSTPVSPSTVFWRATTVTGNVIRVEDCVQESGFSVPGAYVATMAFPSLPAQRYRVEMYQSSCIDKDHQFGGPRLRTSFEFDVKEPSASWPGEPDPVMPVVQYFHQGFQHYFITADENEQVALDSGRFAGWTLSEIDYFNDVGKYGFWRSAAGHVPVCRFFSASFAPRSSHFYTADAAECELVKRNAAWQYEGVVGYVSEARAGGTCSEGVPLHRLYNGGRDGAPSHKYTANPGVMQSLTQYDGWIYEGVMGCVPAIPAPFPP